MFSSQFLFCFVCCQFCFNLFKFSTYSSRLSIILKEQYKLKKLKKLKKLFKVTFYFKVLKQFVIIKPLKFIKCKLIWAYLITELVKLILKKWFLKLKWWNGLTSWNDETLFEPIDGGRWRCLDHTPDLVISVDHRMLIGRGILPSYSNWKRNF
jgi:hypothetical protein